MIEYRISGVAQLAAAQLAHPSLVRLRGRGPWVVRDEAGTCILRRGDAVAWGEWKTGLSGLSYRLSNPLPEMRAVVKFRGNGAVSYVDLPMAGRLPIMPAAYAPVALGLDGTPEGPCDDYGQTAARLFDRLNAGEVTLADPELVAFCRSALMSTSDLTDELCHAFGLITTSTVPIIWEAATGMGKATSDGGL